MPWLDELVILMDDANVGTLGVDMFTSTKSAPPILASGEATLSIVETSGSSPERTQNSVIKPAYLNLAAQFLARAGTYAKAKAKAQAAYDAVVGIRNVTVTDNALISGWYREITPLQEPFDAGVDDRGQARCAFNVIAIRSTKT